MDEEEPTSEEERERSGAKMAEGKALPRWNRCE